jgi:hypothetical protein
MGMRTIREHRRPRSRGGCAKPFQLRAYARFEERHGPLSERQLVRLEETRAVRPAPSRPELPIFSVCLTFTRNAAGAVSSI